MSRTSAARSPTPETPALALADVTVRVEGAGRDRLHGIDWQVRPGEHWAVIGANGAGKTTLLRTAWGTVQPTFGSVTVLGEEHGAPGLRDPRLRMAVIDGAPRSFAPQMTAADVVVLRSAGAFALFGAPVRGEDRERAAELLARFGCAHLHDRRYGECSLGERQRIVLARALMREPALLLYDEPTTGLDLPSRETLLQAMTRLAADRPEVTTVTVTHHLEELPAATTHALLLRDGEVVAAGPVAETLTGEALSGCFDVAVRVERVGDRWAAFLAPAA